MGASFCFGYKLKVSNKRRVVFQSPRKIFMQINVQKFFLKIFLLIFYSAAFFFLGFVFYNVLFPEEIVGYKKSDRTRFTTCSKVVYKFGNQVNFKINNMMCKFRSRRARQIFGMKIDSEWRVVVETFGNTCLTLKVLDKCDEAGPSIKK